MALAVDATSSTTNVTNQTAGGTTTISHTCTGSNLVLIVGVSTWNNGGTGTGCSSVTYNSVAMTQVGTGATNGAFYTEQWRLVNPATGAHNIVATVAGKTDKLGLGNISFTGADQTTGIDVSTTATGTAASVTGSVTTTAANEYVVGCMSHLSANTSSAHSGTAIYEDAAVGTNTAAQYAAAASAGSNSVSWTMPDPGDAWAFSILAVKATGGGGATAHNLLMIGVGT